MVIECTPEIDVVRIGIDRYSLKTGLKLKTIMDLSTSVLKEPRGFIRVIQCLMAIIAFSTTASFSTECEFLVSCKGDDADPPITVDYNFGYPFLLSNNILPVPRECPETDAKNRIELTLPFDFSNAAEFFVATGVITFLYTIFALVVYIFFHQTYANDTKVPVIDLGITAILSIFWLAGSSAWAQGVSDLKYYLDPDTLFKMLNICMQDETNTHCQTKEEGSYGTLNASLILGFANFLLWVASLWFIYKETIFHTPAVEVVQTTQNQASKEIGRV